MFKGFKEFLSRGNIVDLAVAVVIGTAFTGLVTKFTESVITPLTSSIGADQQTDVSLLKIPLWNSGQEINLNTLLSAFINFVLIAAVVYFLVVLPYDRLRKKGEVEQADDAQVVLLTEIRDLLAQTNGDSQSSGRHGGATVPIPEHGPRADAEQQLGRG